MLLRVQDGLGRLRGLDDVVLGPLDAVRVAPFAQHKFGPAAAAVALW